MRSTWLTAAGFLIMLAAGAAGQEAGPDAAMLQIRVNAERDVASVPRRLFGTNLRQNMQQDEPIREFLKQTGITLFRYPDSIDAGYRWDWDNGGVMARGGKPMISKLSRFDGAVELARAVGAEMCFTVKIHDSSPQEAARWVAEAKKRGRGGGYWCFGNEPYFKGDPHYMTRQQYVELVNSFAPAMKRADPEIRLGIAWGGPWIEENSDKGRDSFVLRHTKRWVDFVDFHFYTGRWDKPAGMDARRIMAGSMLVAEHTRKFREIFHREAPEKAERIEIQYWEWNGPPWPEVGGIQTLATALFAADALGQMARHGVSAAIQYNLQEHACGLIPGFEQDRADSWATEPWNGRTVRPIAYAMQLWSREMGPVLVDSSVSGAGSYQTKDWHALVNYQGEVPLASVHATRSEDRRRLALMVINRDEDRPANAQISLLGFMPSKTCEVLILNGPDLLSHNDEVRRQPAYHSFKDAPEPVVRITRKPANMASRSFRWTFPAHSVSVIVMDAQ